MQLQLADQLPRPTKDPESLAAVGKWLSVADLEHSLALWACLGVIVTGASHAAAEPAQTTQSPAGAVLGKRPFHGRCCRRSKHHDGIWSGP